MGVGVRLAKSGSEQRRPIMWMVDNIRSVGWDLSASMFENFGASAVARLQRLAEYEAA